MKCDEKTKCLPKITKIQKNAPEIVISLLSLTNIKS